MRELQSFIRKYIPIKTLHLVQSFYQEPYYYQSYFLAILKGMWGEGNCMINYLQRETRSTPREDRTGYAR